LYGDKNDDIDLKLPLQAPPMEIGDYVRMGTAIFIGPDVTMNNGAIVGPWIIVVKIAPRCI
jgi:acetyltransferase-like isoleucine patch superfamily enzyme